MQKLISDTLWNQLRKLNAASTRKVAAVAYVSDDSILKFGKGDVLVVDASDQAIKCGETSAAVLKRFSDKGARLYSCSGLHAKIFVFDETAVIGSANVSRSSASALIEAAVVTNQIHTVATARLFVERLSRESTLIGRAFLDRIRSLPVSRVRRGGQRRNRPTVLGKAPSRTWMINVTQLDEERFPEEATAVAAGMKTAERRRARQTADVAWIRWTGPSRFRELAREGDTVIQIWKTDRSKPPRAVYPHAPILLRQVESACTRFYLEEPRDGTEMSWPAFLRLTKRIGLPGTVGPFSEREIPDDYSDALLALWRKR